MWIAKGTNLQMAEGDYGITLPIVISGVTLGASDSVKLTVKRSPDFTAVVEKTFTNIQSNTVNLVFTEEESELLKPRDYVYVLDWYQSGSFLCNIIPSGSLKVVNKA